MHIPDFNNTDLSKVADSYRKRTKSWRHRSQEYSIDRYIREFEGALFEVISLDIEAYFDNSLSVHIWEDRHIVVQAIAPNSLPEIYSTEGRALFELGSKVLVDAIDETLGAFPYENTNQSMSTYSEIWSGLVSTDLKIVQFTQE